MLRIRLFRPDEDGALRYHATLESTLDDLGDAGQTLVARGEAITGDVAYIGDFFLRLESVAPIRWTQMSAGRPELQDLYGLAVAAEAAKATYQPGTR